MQQIKRGMSVEEVHALLGAPQHTVEKNGEIQWMVYGSPAERLWIYVEGQAVEALPQPDDDREPRRLQTAE